MPSESPWELPGKCKVAAIQESNTGDWNIL